MLTNRPILFLTLILVSGVVGKNFDPNEIRLVKSYIKKQSGPVQVILYSCWEKQKLLRTLDEFIKDGIYTTTIVNFSKSFNWQFLQSPLIVTDMKCPHFSNLLDLAEKHKFFTMPFKWLIFNYENNFIAPTRKILLDSNLLVVAKNSENEFNLELIYKINENDTNFVYNELGKYSHGDFTTYNQFLLGVNRTNLMGSTLTISYVLTDTTHPIDFINYRYRHIDDFCKLSYALTHYMLETLNCTKKYILRKSWGYKIPNSTKYTPGMFNDLQNGAAEIGGSVAFYTLDRIEIVDYVFSSSPGELRFMMRPPPLSYIENLFTMTFETKVWYVLFIIVAITVAILYVIVIAEFKFERYIDNEETSPNKIIGSNLSDILMVQIGAITQQGSESEPRSNAGQIAMFTILLILMFLYTAYSANIVVLLQSTSTNIKTVEDLLEKPIGLGVHDTVYNRYHLEHEEDPLRKAIYEKKIAPKNQKANYMTLEQGIKRIHHEFFAFQCETSMGYKVIIDTYQESEKCGFIEIDFLNKISPSLSVRKNSPYKKIVKIGYQRLYENGIHYREVSRVYSQKPQCHGTGGTFVSVGLIETYFPFSMFCAGVIISVLVLLVEVLCRRYLCYGSTWLEIIKCKFLGKL